MKRRILIFILLISLFVRVSAFADIEISSPSAILIDANTGVVLYEKDADKKMYPASTTKIMTAILAIENGNMNDILTASQDAVNSISYDSSKINLAEGEQMSCKDLIYSLIVASANDAANVLAEYIGGSSDDFVAMMNEKAVQIGAENTHFINAHGLHDENHYTTARDLAKIARYAMTLPIFQDAVSMASYKISPTNMCETERLLTTTNQLLISGSPYYYSYATGIKTGYTSQAGNCLVSSAENDSMSLLCVVLGAKPEDGETRSFVDSRNIYKWAFSSLKPFVIAEKGSIIGSVPIKNSYADEAILESATSIQALLPDGKTADDLEMRQVFYNEISAPVQAGDNLGRIEYYYDGKMVAEAQLLSVSSYDRIPLPFLFKPLYKFFHWPFSYVILAVLIIWYLLRRQKQRRIERRKRMHETQRRERNANK